MELLIRLARFPMFTSTWQGLYDNAYSEQQTGTTVPVLCVYPQNPVVLQLGS